MLYSFMIVLYTKTNFPINIVPFYHNISDISGYSRVILLRFKEQNIVIILKHTRL